MKNRERSTLKDHNTRLYLVSNDGEGNRVAITLKRVASPRRDAINLLFAIAEQTQRFVNVYVVTRQYLHRLKQVKLTDRLNLTTLKITVSAETIF